MSLNEHERISTTTESLSPSSDLLLNTIDQIEAAFFDDPPPFLVHAPVPVERRHDAIWEIDQVPQLKTPDTEDFSGIYEWMVYQNGNIEKIYHGRTGKKVFEVDHGDLAVGDIFELFFRITHNGERRALSLVIHVTMLKNESLYGEVYGRPLYNGKKDEFFKKTESQAKIPFPIYSNKSTIRKGTRNFSATFCRWIKTAQVMEQDIEYIVIRKPQLIEKAASKVKGLIGKII